MTETPLAADSQQFKAFEAACPKGERMRIRYLNTMPDDPALPEELRKSGIPTIVEGNAVSIDDVAIIFTMAVASLVASPGTPIKQVVKPMQRTIAREQILEITPVGESEPAFEQV